MSEPPFRAQVILEALRRHDVDFLVVGGVAAQAHGANRLTKDIDCLPEPSADNLDRLANALRELNARLIVEGMTDEEAQELPLQLDPHTLRQISILNLMTDAGQVDVLRAIPDQGGQDRSYHDLVSRSIQYSADGLIVRVAALDDIIASKEHADRDKDREALPELRSLQDRKSQHLQPSPRPPRGPDRGTSR